VVAIAKTNTKAMAIAIVAGILLLVAGLSSMAAWEEIKAFIIHNIGDNPGIEIVFLILIIIASLGGIAVIIGGLLIFKGNVGTGKLLIVLGVGLGLIGFIITLVIGIMEGSLTIGGFLSISLIGIILSVVARVMAEDVPTKR